MPPRQSPGTSGLYTRISRILESARNGVARTVNTTQVVANWLIGREIMEEEQKGRKRAGYGDALLTKVASHLTRDFGSGWSVRNLEYCRVFYLTYPKLLETGARPALRGLLEPAISDPPGRKSNALRSKSAAWEPGRLNPNLSWTH